MLSSMICGAPNMRHGRNAFAWKKAFCCCFVVSNLSGKRICSFFWQFLCFIFALFFQWLFDEHGTPVSHFSVGAGFSKSTQTSTARWYDHQYGSSRWLLAEAWCSGVWAQVLSVHGRQDQIVGWCWLHNSIDFVVCWGKKPSGHFESPCLCRCSWLWNHQSFTSSSWLPVVQRGGALLLGPYLWPCRECLRWLGCSLCCGELVYTWEGLKHIFIHSLNMQRSRMQSMVCWTDSAGGKVAELKMFGFSYSPPLHLYPAEVDFKITSTGQIVSCLELQTGHLTCCLTISYPFKNEHDSTSTNQHHKSPVSSQGYSLTLPEEAVPELIPIMPHLDKSKQANVLSIFRAGSSNAFLEKEVFLELPGIHWKSTETEGQCLESSKLWVTQRCKDQLTETDSCSILE